MEAGYVWARSELYTIVYVIKSERTLAKRRQLQSEESREQVKSISLRFGLTRLDTLVQFVFDADIDKTHS